MTDVSRLTIRRLALLAGSGAERLHDRIVRDLSCPLIEVDEVWSYVGKKQARLKPGDSPDFGDVYTFTALDAASRMIIAYHVGKRDQENTDRFIADLRARLTVMPQITSDGFPAYAGAIAQAFGRSVDYAQMHKVFRAGGARDDDYRTEQPRNPVVTKHAIYGAPDMAKASTSYAERQNGTQRHITGRMRRMVYAFSKKLDHHRAALALGFAWYNFGRIVRTLRVTPAMAGGVTDHVWSLEEFMDAVLGEPAGEKPRGKPLVYRAPERTARELPGGKGWLRVVGEGAAPSKVPEVPAPAPLPSMEQVAVTAPAPMAELSAPAPATPPIDDRQLSLLDWRPKPREPVQLSLFGED